MKIKKSQLNQLTTEEKQDLNIFVVKDNYRSKTKRRENARKKARKKYEKRRKKL